MKRHSLVTRNSSSSIRNIRYAHHHFGLFRHTDSQLKFVCTGFIFIDPIRVFLVFLQGTAVTVGTSWDLAACRSDVELAIKHIFESSPSHPENLSGKSKFRKGNLRKRSPDVQNTLFRCPHVPSFICTLPLPRASTKGSA